LKGRISPKGLNIFNIFLKILQFLSQHQFAISVANTLTHYPSNTHSTHTTHSLNTHQAMQFVFCGRHFVAAFCKMAAPPLQSQELREKISS